MEFTEEYFNSLSPKQRALLNADLNIKLNETGKLGDVRLGGDPYNNVLINKANRLYQRVNNEPEDTKEYLLNKTTPPLAIRAMANSLSDTPVNYTEADLTTNELDELRKAVHSAEMRRLGGRPYNGVQYSNYNNPITYSSMSLGELATNINNPEFNVINSLGRFDYHTDKNGNVIVTDTYDFNPTSTPKDNSIKSIIKRDYIEANSKPFNWNINLGKQNEWRLYND